MESILGQLKKENAWLKAQNRQLLALLDSMADPAYICSADYRILYLNRAMAETFDVDTSRHCYETVQDNRAPCPHCPMSAILRGETVRQERYFASQDKTYELLHTPLQLGTGHPQKLAVMRDITEHKNSQEKLREANRELDAFVYTVSHDLRSPLTPIIGFSQLIREKYCDLMAPHDLGRLDEIANQANRINQMLKDLLQLARTGNLPLPDQPVELNELVQEVLNELRCQHQRPKLPVKCGELPAVRLPRTQLTQVIENLLDNALRYAAEAASPIEVSARIESGRLHLSVRDFGVGLPECERKRVFDLFSRGTTSGSSAGSGIGLATVRKIARSYNGNARCEETPGGGCTFIVEFQLPPQDSPGP